MPCNNEEQLLRLLKLGAVGGAGIFSGVAIHTSFVDAPARKSLGTALSITSFQASFLKVGTIQVVSSLVAGASGVWAGKILLGYNKHLAKPFFVGGALLLASTPYTIFVIKPKTLNYLLDKKVDKASPKTAEMLDTWENLHLVRTLASLSRFFFFF